jgi:predicted Zn-dependent protease
MVAKLTGFLEPLRVVLRHYPTEDQSLPARYARTIAYYRANQLDRALAGINQLIAELPDDPYFHELKGQMLFENARLEEALPAYEAATAIRPGETTFHLSLAQVQIELNRAEFNEPALRNLEAVLRREPRNGFAWRLAATAHSRLGNQGMTMLALGEAALISGRYTEALDRAKRAQDLLGDGTVAGLQAQDVEFEAQRLLQARK